MNGIYLGRAATAHLKRRPGNSLMIRIVPIKEGGDSNRYHLFTEDGFAGRILFDEDGYWIYDGNELSVEESEEITGFIVRNAKPEYSY